MSPSLLPLSPQPSTAVGASALLTDAIEAFERGEHAKAILCATRAETLAHELDDRKALIQALRLLVALYSREGQPELAVNVGQEALQWLRDSDDDAGRADLLCNIAACFLELGLNEDALSHVSEGVNAARKAGDPRLLCQAYNRVGTANGQLGQFEEAKRFFNDALLIARELQNAEELYRTLNNFGVVAALSFDAARDRGDALGAATSIAQARGFAEEALQVAQASGNSYREAMCLSNLGRYLGLSGEIGPAFELLDEAYAMAMKHGHKALALTCDSQRAEILVAAGRHHQAIPILLMSLERAASLFASPLMFDLRLQLYKAYKARGSTAEALAQHELYHALVKAQLEQRSHTQSRLLLNRLELDQARFGAERAQREANLQRGRAERMQAHTERLEAEAAELGRNLLADALTGLGNRRQIDRGLPTLLQHAASSGITLSVAVLDIDHFKTVNDRFGHPVGDAVLKTLADILRKTLRAGDMMARMGGEEFLIALVDTPSQYARDTCERLRVDVERHAWDDLAVGLLVTVSIGLCTQVTSVDTAEILARADAALYKAKHAGRNQVAEIAPAVQKM
jgi:diguanylate cyclase (GGDEF)-like protein